MAYPFIMASKPMIAFAVLKNGTYTGCEFQGIDIQIPYPFRVVSFPVDGFIFCTGIVQSR